MQETKRKVSFVWGHGLFASQEIDDLVNILDFTTLAKQVNLIRYDAPGHGTSPFGDTGSNSWQRLAETMLTHAREHGGVQPKQCILGGQSMGSATALWAACKAPEIVKALVLVTPPALWQDRNRQAMDRGRVAELLDSGSLASVRALFEALPPMPKYLLPARLRGFTQLVTDVYTKIKANPDGVKRIFYEAAQSDGPPIDMLQTLEMPCLILAWKDDAVHPLSSASMLYHALPNARLVCADNEKDVSQWTMEIVDFIASLNIGAEKKQRGGTTFSQKRRDHR